MEKWWKAYWFSVRGALAFILNRNCLLAMMDSAEFAIRGFFLLFVFLIIKSMVETNFLNKFYFLLSPSVIFPFSLQIQSVESCRKITWQGHSISSWVLPPLCACVSKFHITRHFSGSPDSHDHFWLLVPPSDKLSSVFYI